MVVYLNKTFIKRDYENMNIIMQITDGAPRNLDGSQDLAGNWIAVPAEEVADIETLSGCTFAESKGYMKLGGFGNHDFFGYP